MDRALREFRIRGVATNLTFLESDLTHPKFRDNDLHDALHRHDAGAVPAVNAPRPRDQAAHLYRRRHRQRPSRDARPRQAAGRGARSRRAAALRPARPRSPAPSSGSTRWARKPSPTGCGPRRACSSPTRRCATPTSRCSRRACAAMTSPASPGPMRARLPQLLSLECWGGATFDVAMRFLTEDPWERLS